jgi:hypothetical protein
VSKQALCHTTKTKNTQKKTICDKEVVWLLDPKRTDVREKWCSSASSFKTGRKAWEEREENLTFLYETMDEVVSREP